MSATQSSRAPRRAHPHKHSSRSNRSYYFYGVSIRSRWPLPYPESVPRGAADVELIEAAASFIRDAREAATISSEPGWFERGIIKGGADRGATVGAMYLRWLDMYEFVVAGNGRQIFSRQPAGTSRESFLVYLLNGALPVALLKLGLDPLHATVVGVDGKAVAFLGRSGYGKSTLGGAFLRAGHPVLTDDLVVLKEQGNAWWAHPGPPRIKLLPKSVRAVMSRGVTGAAMNPQTNKLVIPLTARQSLREALPIAALYILNRPPAGPAQGNRIRISRLRSRQALMALLKNSYNDWLEDPARLRLQLMQYAAMAARIPVKRLAYPRRMAQLGDVLDAVLKDLQR